MHTPASMRLFTIGHSTRPIEAFIDFLSTYGITLLIDIRTAPGSRRYPQFSRDALSSALSSVGIGYLHLKALGGWRKPRPESPHTGWRSAGFRGYADYMETPEFAGALTTVLVRAQTTTVALMCAEALPWRCHRQLVADALVVRGAEVLHILDRDHAQAHRLTPFARVDGTRIIYAGPPSSFSSPLPHSR